MPRIVAQRILELRNRLGEGQAEFGHRFGVEQPTVSRWESGASKPARSLEQPIADLAGMTVAEFFHSADAARSIPVVGYVSGGEAFVPIDDHEPGAGLDFVTPRLGDDSYIAVKVRGDSMSPVYRDGDLIIAARAGRRDMSKMIGRDCIVKTAAGEGYVKRVLAGTKKGTVRLRSYNPAYDDIEDVQIEWAAAIVWIGRGQ